MTRSRYRFLGTDAPYFPTMTISNWPPVFTRPATTEVILNSWRHLQASHDLRLNRTPSPRPARSRASR